jgi:hypothetical protein
MAFGDLFRPRWKNSNPDTRRAAVSALSNTNILAEIALFDRSAEVRASASARLDEIQKAPARARAEAARARAEAADAEAAEVMKLTDQTVLARIAKTEGYPEKARVTAVNKLTDQTVLAEIAKTEGYPQFVRIAAVDKLTDQAVLAEIAKTAEGPAREQAIYKLTDRTLLVDISESLGNDGRLGSLRSWIAKEVTGNPDLRWCPHCKSFVVVNFRVDDAEQEFLKSWEECCQCRRVV